MATASAIMSCVGLGVGHLLGLILAIAAVRRMDDSRGTLYGYRLALTGCIVGLVGMFLDPLRAPAIAGQFAGGVAFLFLVGCVHLSD